MQKHRVGVDTDRLIVLAKGDCRPLTAQNAERAQILRSRHRDMTAQGHSVETIPILTELAELTAEPWVLRSLVKALRHNGEQQAASRLAQALKSRPVRNAGPPDEMELAAGTALRAGSRKELLERTRAESRANGVALLSNRDALSGLKEMISARIGTAVRHVRSEPVIVSHPVPLRSIVHRRGYTKHWFELTGAIDSRLRDRFGDEKQLVVFVKSSLLLRTRPQLEFILNEQTGRGFRTPYFFGQFSVSDMQIAAWESIDIDRIEVWRLSFEDQRRLVKAIAGVNALAATGAAPVTTKWIQRSPKWFEARFAELPAARGKPWEDLYRRTVSVLEHQAGLATRIRSARERFATHNDVTGDGSNILVQKDGDVIIFDWEGSTLSVPGADLGLLTQLDEGDRLMSVYVEEMAEHGIDLNLENIRFTAEVLWGFRILQHAWRTRMPNQVDLALNMLSRHTNRARP